MKHDKLKVHHSAGFSLVELMLAMLIGIIILGGVMSLYLTTRDTQRSSEDQLVLLGDARFAIETIAYDLRHTGMWGETNETKLIACHSANGVIYPDMPCADPVPAAVADCAVLEYADFEEPLFGSNNANPYGTTCVTQAYKAGTDVLGVRYADSNRIPTADLAANVMYVRSNIQTGQVFRGKTLPAATIYKWNDDTVTHNHRLISRYYYVSDYTSTVGDGLPSLRQVDLIAGPEMSNEVLLPGVENFQLEFAIDTDCPRDGQANTYVNASNVADWSNGSVLAVKVWVLARSNRVDRDNISKAQTFTIAGTSVTTPNDGYRRMVASSVVKLRNMQRFDLQAKSGGC